MLWIRPPPDASALQHSSGRKPRCDLSEDEPLGARRVVAGLVGGTDREEAGEALLAAQPPDDRRGRLYPHDQGPVRSGADASRPCQSPQLAACRSLGPALDGAGEATAESDAKGRRLVDPDAEREAAAAQSSQALAPPGEQADPRPGRVTLALRARSGGARGRATAGVVAAVGDDERLLAGGRLPLMSVAVQRNVVVSGRWNVSPGSRGPVESHRAEFAPAGSRRSCSGSRTAH